MQKNKKVLMLTLVHPDFLPPIYAAAQVLRDQGYHISIITFNSFVPGNISIGDNIEITTVGEYHTAGTAKRIMLRRKFRKMARKEVDNDCIAVVSFCPFSFLCGVDIKKQLPLIYITLEISNFEWRYFLRSPLSNLTNLHAINNLKKATLLATPSYTRSYWLAGRGNLNRLPHTIHNTSYITATPEDPNRALFEKLVPAGLRDKTAILYTGTINSDLCILELIHGFELVQNEDCCLLITGIKDTGYCVAVSELVEKSSKKSLIKLFPVLPREQMLALQSNSKIGVSFVKETDDNLESKMIAPNKIGEYFAKGLYLLGIDVPYMRQFEYKKIATLAKSLSPEHIATAISAAIANTNDSSYKLLINELIVNEFSMQRQLQPVIDVLAVKKKLLIFAYDYHGRHSVHGTALSRRVKQVAQSYRDNGWKVMVVHKDQRNELPENTCSLTMEMDGIERFMVNSNTAVIEEKFITLRKAKTLLYTLFKGDRSISWAQQVIKFEDKINAGQANLIISFFTPRAPLYLGHYFSEKYNIPWIADMQDEADEGTSKSLLSLAFLKIWTRKVLKTATAIVQVSPEWAAKNSKFLGLETDVIRHAVPKAPGSSICLPESGKEKLVLFYGGSLNRKDQSLDVLKKVLTELKHKDITLKIAADKPVVAAFRDKLKGLVVLEELGWLNNDAYEEQVNCADCCIVIPWSSQPRQVIPSKFYELCSFKKPVWIVGEDTGAFKYLFEEWGHPAIPCDDVAYQVKALNALIEDDDSLMFRIENCKGKPITEDQLSDLYQQLL